MFKSSEDANAEFHIDEYDNVRSYKGSAGFWMTSPDANAPHVIVVAFESQVHLKQLHLLSHEYCIPSRIEVWVRQKPQALDQVGKHSDGFKRLGFVSFDKNVGTNFESRELKSVFVDVDTDMVKLVLHAPHENSLNQRMQVGLISIVCLGDPIPSTDVSVRESISKTYSPFEEAPPGGSITPELVSQTLPKPDPLPAYFEREFPELVKNLPVSILENLSSRDWRLRELGLRDMILLESISKSGGEHVLSWVVKKCLSDRIVSIYELVLELMYVWISRGIRPDGDSVEFAVIHMIEHRLLDNNKRVRECTVTALLRLAEDNYFSMVSHYLLKPTKTEITPRQVVGRCMVLLPLVDRKGLRVTKSDKTGIPLDPLLGVLGVWLLTPSLGELRGIPVKLFQSVVDKAGKSTIENTAHSITDAMARDELLFELAKITTTTVPLKPEANVITSKPPPKVSFPKSSSHAPAVVCDFCGIADVKFNQQKALDLHYWNECPALIECRFCEEMVEITNLTEHRLKECAHAAEAIRGIMPISDN